MSVGMAWLRRLLLALLSPRQDDAAAALVRDGGDAEFLSAAIDHLRSPHW